MQMKGRREEKEGKKRKKGRGGEGEGGEEGGGGEVEAGGWRGQHGQQGRVGVGGERERVSSVWEGEGRNGRMEVGNCKEGNGILCGSAQRAEEGTG
uniref:hypothetical protein n=1 Tax=Salmonella enterica TaxID=28901 RepID=UPI00398C5E6C